MGTTVESVAFEGAEARVLRVDRGRTALLRFVGACSPELSKWLPTGFKSLKQAVALNLRGLAGIEAPFVRKILDLAGRKHPLAFIDPPAPVLELLGSFAARDRVALLSAEGALAASGSLPESVTTERAALQDLASRYRVSPLWRRVDQEGGWLCAL